MFLEVHLIKSMKFFLTGKNNSKKMFPNPDGLRNINAEYMIFSGVLGFFSESHVIDARVHE